VYELDDYDFSDDSPDDVSDESQDDVVDDGLEQEQVEDEAPVTTPPAKGKKAENWQEKAQEYEARFKGLQRRQQQDSELAKQLRAQLEQREAELARFQISLLPQEQQQPALMAYQAEQARRYESEQRQAEQSVMAQVLKEHTVTMLSTKYKVPAAELADFDDPYAMEKYAKKVHDMRGKTAKRAEKQARQETDADRFEGTGAPSQPRKAPETMDEARDALVAAMRRATRK